jgi:hypothetical protein
MAKSVPVRELRSELARVLDDVVDRREHVSRIAPMLWSRKLTSP